MSEEEIRLDQTIRVFDILANLISKNETCTYRYLIYDLLGFDKENYAELMSGLTITNALVEKEELENQLQQKENIIKEVRETLINSKEYKMAKEMNLTSKMSVLIELLEILEKESKEWDT